MKRKKLLPISILLLSVLSTLSVNMTGISAVVYPAIKVVPEITTGLTPGENFTVSIYTDYTGWDVAMYQFNLFYNPHVLNGLSVDNGDLITPDEHSSHWTSYPMPGCSAWFIPGPFDNTAGELSLTLGFFTEKEIASGPGTLAHVTFTVVGSGASTIKIGSLTKLIGWNIFAGEEYVIVDAATMSENLQHGFFRNIPEGEVTRNVAVTSLTSPNPVFKGELVDITVDVENLGVVNEDFEVTVYYDSNVIGTETVTNLLNGTTESLTFTWDTAAVPLGTYTINATASTVPDETTTTDNTLEIDVTVAEPLYDPVAVITARDASDVGEEETFDGTGSYDQDLGYNATNPGGIISYEWDFGDGGTDTGAVVTHVFEEGGIYDVQLVVTDSQHQVGVVYKTIVIEDLPPDYAARLVAWKAKSEVHHWRYSWDVDKNVTLAAYAGNDGTNPVDVAITFAILNSTGMAGPAIVEDATLDAGTKVPISVEIVPSDYGWEVGDPKLVLWGHVTLEYYDPVEDEWIPTTPKIFRFSISY